MDKTTRTELYRLFLIDDLPEPLTRASPHLQLFDNYITGTRVRLRSVRDPETKAWQRILQQRTPAEKGRFGELETAEMFLNDAEYGRFEFFEGSEIRKNRYFLEYEDRTLLLDVYLWPLWGLNTARVEFATPEELDAFEPPPFARREITDDEFFWPANLVGKKIEDVMEHTAKWENETE